MTVRNLEVLASNFAFSFPTKMLKFIMDNLVSGQAIQHHSTLGGRADIEQRRLKAVLDVHPAPGVISIAVRPDPEFVSMYAKAGIPLILIDEEAEGASTIAVDNYKGGVLAAERFLTSKKKTPAIVCGRTEMKGGSNAAKRLKGFQDTLKSNRYTLEQKFVKEVVDYSYHDGVAAMQEWIQQGSIPDFVFSAAGDDCAIGILRAAAEHDVGVPSYMSVVGFDDLDSAKMSTPTLTTIRQPLQEIAARAYSMASTVGDQYIERPERIILEPSLIVRDSA